MVAVMKTKPIFIFSLPRSGSTLLQNMLAGHQEVVTTPEPWILLPPLYALRSEGVYSEYNHSMTERAIAQFCTKLPNGEVDYLDAVRAFGTRLYEDLAQDRAYFLDKTPRYHVISGDIIKAFPEGKFIILGRNPLAVLASILETWKAFHLFRYDLYLGLASLVTTLQEYSEIVTYIRYEDLVEKPEEQLREICDYLELEFQQTMLTAIPVDLDGVDEFGYPVRMDGTGREDYQDISTDSVSKWTGILAASGLRKLTAGKYLSWIGSDRLLQLGYDPALLEAELDGLQVNNTQLLNDILRWIRGFSSTVFEGYLWKNKISRIKKAELIFPHQ